MVPLALSKRATFEDLLSGGSNLDFAGDRFGLKAPSGTSIARVVYSGCDFSGAEFLRFDFKEVTFHRCTFAFTTFDTSWFQKCVFDSCSFYGAKFEDVHLECQMNDVHLDNCDLSFCSMEACNFLGSKISASEFRNCNLSGAVMKSTVLVRDVFYFCDLTDTDLSNAYLRDVSLRNCAEEGLKVNAVDC